MVNPIENNQSHTEIWRIDDNNTKIEETKKIFNELRNNFFKKERHNIRLKFYVIETIGKYLQALEEKGSLTKQEKKDKKRYTKILQKAEEYLKELKEDLNKLKRQRYNIIDGIEYKRLKEIKNLFNRINEEEYYKPIKTKHAFDDDYMEYESRVDKDNLSLEQYLNIIRPYLRDMIDNHKAEGEWKIQLVMKIIFVSSLDVNEIRTMHTKSNNIEIASGFETNNIINELFRSLIKRYQENVETKMRGSEFVFYSVDLLYYILHKIRLNRGGSYIDSLDWIKRKKATINPKNKNNKCLKYAITAALNHEGIRSDPQRISTLEPFIDNYNWKDIEFPSHSMEGKKFERNNNTIALNILFVPYNTKQMRQA